MMSDFDRSFITVARGCATIIVSACCEYEAICLQTWWKYEVRLEDATVKAVASHACITRGGAVGIPYCKPVGVSSLGP